MLRSLLLQNFVLIDRMKMEFDQGFHALTGETGAGKTLLIQAMYLLSGQKVSSDIIRKGEEKALLEATFDIEKLFAVQILLNEAGIEFDPKEYLIIKREVSRTSKNRIFINSQMAPHSLLSKIGPLLFSLINQNSSLSMRQGEAQRSLIDTFGNLHQDVLAFFQSYQENQDLQKELSSLQSENIGHPLEKLRWELEEWEAFQYQEGEDETLFEEYKTLANFQDTSDKLQSIQGNLDHPSLLPSLAQCQKLSENLSESALSEHLKSAVLHLQEASYLVSQTLENFEHHPGRYEALEKRLSALNALKKKYQLETSEIPSHLEKIKERIDRLSNVGNQISALQKKLSDKEEIQKTLSTSLTAKREAASEKFQHRLSEELKQLNLPYAEVHIQVIPKDMGPYGSDQIKISLSANQGEPPAPIESKVSGGELSRFLFATTLILAKKSKLPTLIFDEIDSNVGGETATVVGQKLRTLGETCQVLVITHFAQVARFANHHLQISKIEKEGRTLTHIQALDSTGIEEELIRMVGGKETLASHVL